jgi:hypothetical protein
VGVGRPAAVVGRGRLASLLDDRGTEDTQLQMGRAAEALGGGEAARTVRHLKHEVTGAWPRAFFRSGSVLAKHDALVARDLLLGTA